MDKKDENKQPPQNPGNQPPRPPAGAPKKQDPLPKGPVPPRPQGSAPRGPLPGPGGNKPGLPSMKPPTGVPQKPGMAPQPGAPKPPMTMGGGQASKPPFGLPGLTAPTPAAPAPAPMQPPMPNLNKPAAPMPAAPAPMAPPAGGPPKPPTPFEQQARGADSASQELESKVAELEKRLMEEKEKVLLASLRTKEEEAIASKVETSIKDIQDKLRRDKKEQEMEEARRKAEARVLDIERRLGEEREAWVQTLKNQLGQRDQVTQEMESHFASRLKDLEYRWAQEKSVLEQAVRDRESDIARAKQEMALKSDQEKAFWEDRIRSVMMERDKLDRELERTKNKLTQDVEQLHSERQMLRQTISQLEASNKISQDQYQYEMSFLKRQVDTATKELLEKTSATDGLKSQIAQFEKINYGQQIQLDKVKEETQKELLMLKNQLEHAQKESIERGATLDALRSQLMQLQNQSTQSQIYSAESVRQIDTLKNKLNEKDRLIEKIEGELERANLENKAHETFSKEFGDQRSKLERLLRESTEKNSELEKELSQRKRDFEIENQALIEQIEKIRSESKASLAQSQADADARVRTLQTRLDWYDLNANREYEKAKDSVRVEMEELQKKLAAAERRVGELLKAEVQKNEVVLEKENLQKEIEQVRNEWKQSQWDLDSRLREMQEALKAEQERSAQAQEKRIALEQEIHQLHEARNYDRTLLEQRRNEIEGLVSQHSLQEKNQEMARSRIRDLMEEIEEQKKIMRGEGFQTLEDLRKKVELRDNEISELKQKIRDFKEQSKELDQADVMFREKEKLLKNSLDEKDSILGEFKNRIMALERSLKESHADLENVKLGQKKALERMLAEKENELETKLLNEKNRLLKLNQEEIEKARVQAAEETAARLRSEMQYQMASQPNIDPAVIEAQVKNQLEEQNLERIRNIESEWEEKIKKLKEDAKKDADKVKWESESLKEELKRAREARAQIEREAQDLIQQAEEHYRNELAKKISEATEKSNKSRGIFSAIGRILDTPIIDTNKDKDHEQKDAA